MSENVINTKVELSEEQKQRATEVHEAALQFCRTLTGYSELEWNMRFIEPIVDYAAQIMISEGIPVHYPSVVTDEDGTKRVAEYVNDFAEDDDEDRIPF